MNNGLQQKSFWQKKEGKVGYLVLALIIGFGGYLLYNALPIIISLLENGLYAFGMAAVLGTFLYMAFDKRVRTLIWYLYKSLIRKVTGFIIVLDPIAIIEGYLGDIKDSLEDMETQIANLSGQIRIISKKVEDRRKQFKRYEGLALAARNKGSEYRGQMSLNLRKSQREEEAMKRYIVLKDKMEAIFKVLSKMKSYSAIMIEDISHEIELKKDERKMIRTSHSAMKSAMSIINGNNDKKEMFDLAMEHIADDIGMRIGQMEIFMDNSADFMNNIDLENAMFEEQGLANLDKWVKDSNLMFGDYVSPIKGNITESINASESLEKVVITNSSENTNRGNKYF